jgi:hypothetical protein
MIKTYQLISSKISDLIEILNNNKIDVRFLGNDYIDKHYTGKGLPIEIKFIDRVIVGQQLSIKHL